MEKYKHLIDKEEYDELDILEKPSSSASASGLDNPQASQISNMLNDKYFEMFSNTVKHNPGQVLRYDLEVNHYYTVAKMMLLLAQPANIPRPSFNPSSERRFELQLMPKAIMDLEDLGNNRNVGINDILNGMSWGTIIVCTDEEDFIPEENFDANQVGYIEEWCGSNGKKVYKVFDSLPLFLFAFYGLTYQVEVNYYTIICSLVCYLSSLMFIQINT